MCWALETSKPAVGSNLTMEAENTAERFVASSCNHQKEMSAAFLDHKAALILPALAGNAVSAGAAGNV